MRFIGLGIIIMLAGAPALWADDPPTNQGKDKARVGKDRVAQGAIMEQVSSREKMSKSTFLDR